MVYPDAFVRCGPLDDDATEVDDPVLVVEIQSPSTKRYDMNEKRWAYQSLATLQHMLFLSPRRCLVEVVTRQADGRWLSTLVHRLDEPCRLEALAIELPVAELYAGTSVGSGGRAG